MISSALSELKKEYEALRAPRKRLRDFGLLVGIIFAVLGAMNVLQHGFGWGNEIALTIGVFLIIFGAFLPQSLSGLYRLWMGLALVLGLIVGTMLLFVLFYLIVTPIGLLQRLFGDDPLRRRREPAASTYWQPHAQRGGEHMRRPF